MNEKKLDSLITTLLKMNRMTSKAAMIMAMPSIEAAAKMGLIIVENPFLVDMVVSVFRKNRLRAHPGRSS